MAAPGDQQSHSPPAPQQQQQQAQQSQGQQGQQGPSPSNATSNSAGHLSFRRYLPAKAPIVIASMRQTLTDVVRPTRQRASRACEVSLFISPPKLLLLVPSRGLWTRLGEPPFGGFSVSECAEAQLPLLLLSIILTYGMANRRAHTDMSCPQGTNANPLYRIPPYMT
jgi:hypothetical protein